MHRQRTTPADTAITTWVGPARGAASRFSAPLSGERGGGPAEAEGPWRRCSSQCTRKPTAVPTAAAALPYTVHHDHVPAGVSLCRPQTCFFSLAVHKAARLRRNASRQLPNKRRRRLCAIESLACPCLACSIRQSASRRRTKDQAIYPPRVQLFHRFDHWSSHGTLAAPANIRLLHSRHCDLARFVSVRAPQRPLSAVTLSALTGSGYMVT